MISEGDYIAIAAIEILLLGITIVTLIDPYINARSRKYLLINIALSAVMVAQNVAENYLSYYGDIPPARTVTAICGYVAGPLIILIFCHILAPERSHLPMWILLAVNFAVNLTSLFSSIAFSINENRFVRGPLGYSSHICAAFMLVYLVYLTLNSGSGWNSIRNLLPIFNALTVIGGVVLDSFIVHTSAAVTYMIVSMVCSCIFYYIWLHLRFVSDHQKALEAEQRIRIMMSQIQPHFLYNTLSSIQALCRVDPDKAFDVTGKFGAYLRSNLDSLDQPGLIPFQKEIEHTKLYTEIEKVRFPDIDVEYDLEQTAFSLPALTVQPIVENAIRHGVRGREHGVVRVVSKKEGNCFEIAISDNGVGFDVNTPAAPEKQHIGISNVRDRIESMCGGTLSVESTPGEGTCVTIRVPCEAETETAEKKKRVKK